MTDHRLCRLCSHDVTAHTSCGCTQNCECMADFGIVDFCDPDDPGLQSLWTPEAQPYVAALLSLPFVRGMLGVGR